MAGKPNPATEADTHLAVGVATTAWGNIEVLLHHVFVQAVDPSGIGGGAAARAFWEVVSFKGKIDMTHAAVSYATRNNPGLHARWVNLRKKATRESKKRNELAHGEVMRESFNKGGVETHSEVVFRPYSFKEIYKRQDNREYAPLKRTAQDIIQFVGKLYELSDDIKRFLYDLRTMQAEALPEQLERQLDRVRSGRYHPKGPLQSKTAQPDEPSPE
ncbi:hypothetical protein [Hyphobacterium marinum]|uniref:Uncharacterized protein n=1 Tax=Hyphobacterium marinum TaxID=3116574 RepID=A0ABU7M1S8_9PROT|nr:hypothetical protein [Hyphobacterium sp. Y6023]MEE2567355.1 hypothetical protein [Hyphobacterium sp. Y6023]